MSVDLVGVYDVGQIVPNVQQLVSDVNTMLTSFIAFKASFSVLQGTLSASLDILATVEGGIDFILNAQFGLVPLKLSALLEFQGSLRAIAGLTLAISNPLSQAIAAITAMAAATASLQASLALGLPTVSVELGMQLSVIAAVSAAAAAKMAGIQAVIDVAGGLIAPLLDVRLRLNGLISDLGALLAAFEATIDIVLALSAQFTVNFAGPGVRLYAISSTGSNLGVELAGAFATPPAGIAGTDAVRAVIAMVNYTVDTPTWANLSFVLRTTP